MLGSTWLLQASTIHMTMPPTSSAIAMAFRLPRFFSLHLRSSRANTEVTAKATSVSEMGCVSQLRSPFSPLGKVRMKFTIRSVNKKQSARMAPTWMTMVYMSQ